MTFYQVFKSAGRLIDDLHIVTVSHDYQIWGLIFFSNAFAILDIDDTPFFYVFITEIFCSVETTSNRLAGLFGVPIRLIFATPLSVQLGCTFSLLGLEVEIEYSSLYCPPR